MNNSVRDLPLAELRSLKGNDGADAQAIGPALASAVLTESTGFEFGDLGLIRRRHQASKVSEGRGLTRSPKARCGLPLTTAANAAKLPCK
jgi:hypothetical protein